MGEQHSFVVTCPCCQAKLTIDAELSAVIAHEVPPPKRTADDLGSAFDKLRKQSAEREERFRQQMEAERQKGKVLGLHLLPKPLLALGGLLAQLVDRKSTRLNSSHL